MNRLTRVDVTRPPRMTIAMGCSISWPGILPMITRGTSASPVVSVVIRIGESLSRAPRSISPGRRHAFIFLEMLAVTDQHDAVARGDTHHREESDQRAERQDAAARYAARTPPTRATGSVKMDMSPAASSRRTPAAGGRPRPVRQSRQPESAVGGLTFRVLAQDSVVDPTGNSTARRAFWTRHNRGEIAVLRRWPDVDAPGAFRALMRWAWRQGDAATSASRICCAARGVDRQVLDAAHAVRIFAGLHTCTSYALPAR